MGIKVKLPKAFVGLSVITVCAVGAILSPWIRDAWESFQQAEQSEKGPEYHRGMHDSGIFWGAVPPDSPTPPSVQRWPRATDFQGQDPHR
jgi:hypothetical protein